MKKIKTYIAIILSLGLFYFFMFKDNYARLDNPANIPNNLDESFIELDHTLPLATRLTMRFNDEKSMGNYHRGLGMTLRNQWGLWKGSKLNQYFQKQGIYNADNMSGIILTSYWRYLNNQPIQLEAQVSYYKEFGRRQKQAEEAEKLEVPKRIKRVQKAMMGWTFNDQAVPSVLLPKRIDFSGTWKLESYRGGFLAVFSGYKPMGEFTDRVWHSGIYFVASSTAPMQPVKRTGCEVIYDVVTHKQITYWLCRKGNKWALLVENGDRSIKETSIELSSSWLRLVNAQDEIFLMDQKSIYKRNGQQWQPIFTSLRPANRYQPFEVDDLNPQANREIPWSFPPRVTTPYMIGYYIYLPARANGNLQSLWRLNIQDKNADLESMDNFFTRDYYGNWGRYGSQILPISDHSFWLTTSMLSDQDTLVKFEGNEIKIALYGGQVKFDGEIGDVTLDGNKRQNRISAQAIYRSNDNVLYLAGLGGLFRVERGVVRPIVRFHLPIGITTGNYEEGYRRMIKPQQLERFTDGGFLLGDAYSGLYRLQKDIKGIWQLSLLHQQIAEAVTFDR
jgi:hypothetical protein